MTLYRTPKTAIAYADSADDDHPAGWVIEIGDEVEWVERHEAWGAIIQVGQITAIQPRNWAVKVSYLDEHDLTKAGGPRRKVATVGAERLTLIARTM